MKVLTMNTRRFSFLAIITVAACLLISTFSHNKTLEDKSQAIQQNIRSFPGMVYFEM
jgi:hypothetical protein